MLKPRYEGIPPDPDHSATEDRTEERGSIDCCGTEDITIDISDGSSSGFKPHVLQSADPSALVAFVTQAQKDLGHCTVIANVDANSVSRFQAKAPAVPLGFMLHDLFGNASDFLLTYHKDRGDFNMTFPKWQVDCRHRSRVVVLPHKQHTMQSPPPQAGYWLTTMDYCWLAGHTNARHPPPPAPSPQWAWVWLVAPKGVSPWIG